MIHFAVEKSHMSSKRFAKSKGISRLSASIVTESRRLLLLYPWTGKTLVSELRPEVWLALLCDDKLGVFLKVALLEAAFVGRPWRLVGIERLILSLVTRVKLLSL
jgi:hypothetical protein